MGIAEFEEEPRERLLVEHDWELELELVARAEG